MEDTGLWGVALCGACRRTEGLQGYAGSPRAQGEVCSTADWTRPGAVMHLLKVSCSVLSDACTYEYTHFVLCISSDIRVALSNSFGFGGHNSCVMFKPPPQ